MTDDDNSDANSHHHRLRRHHRRSSKAAAARTSTSSLHLPLALLATTALLVSDGRSSSVVLAQEADGGGATTATASAVGGGVPTTPTSSVAAAVLPKCTRPPPTCSSRYYKIADESNGLATSCAAVDQTADPVVGLSQTECQTSCDGLDGCDTINFRWRDPNFAGQSTCYRKNCGNFQQAACTLFSKHKERDVYTKACGADELWDSYVLGNPFDGLFAGVQCPDPEEETVEAVLEQCIAVPETDDAEVRIHCCLMLCLYYCSLRSYLTRPANPIAILFSLLDLLQSLL